MGGCWEKSTTDISESNGIDIFPDAIGKKSLFRNIRGMAVYGQEHRDEKAGVF